MIKEKLTKRCSKCKQHLLLQQFSNSKKQRDGKHNYCKTCSSNYQKEWRKQALHFNSEKYFLKRSCSAALRRSKPSYTKDGYANETSSYSSSTELFKDLWNDDEFQKMWIAQTKVFNETYDNNDRPTLDRIDTGLGYEKNNIRVLPQGENRFNGAQKACEVYVIKNQQVQRRMEYRGVGEAKNAVSAFYSIPAKRLNCVDHGTIAESDNGVGVLIQSRDGQTKIDDESKYLMVMNKYEIVYNLDTGVEVARKHHQIQSEVSGIVIGTVKS